MAHMSAAGCGAAARDAGFRKQVRGDLKAWV